MKRILFKTAVFVSFLIAFLVVLGCGPGRFLPGTSWYYATDVTAAVKADWMKAYASDIKKVEECHILEFKDSSSVNESYGHLYSFEDNISDSRKKTVNSALIGTVFEGDKNLYLTYSHGTKPTNRTWVQTDDRFYILDTVFIYKNSVVYGPKGEEYKKFK